MSSLDENKNKSILHGESSKNENLEQIREVLDQSKINEGVSEESPAVDWTWMRERIASVWGRDYWRSLSEIAESPEFLENLSKEFPDKARPLPDDISRREFVKLMGASLALAGLTGCTRQPNEKIVPYVKAPEEIIPGKPLYFASALTFSGIARGILVESNMGRPTKIEGNPEHPESRGATDVFTQASILSLYDPDRSKSPVYMARTAGWDAFFNQLRNELDIQKAKKGAGFRILTGAVSSPTLLAQLDAIKKEFPESSWHVFESVNRDQVRKASKDFFGRPLQPVYKLDQADVVVSLDADFLASGAGHLKYARDFAKKRQIHEGGKTMNRLYVIESSPSATGTASDHRLALSSRDILPFAGLLALELGVKVSGIDFSSVQNYSEWVKALARDLKKNPAASVVIPGDYQSAELHMLAHAINEALGNQGKTMEYTALPEAGDASHLESLWKLVTDMRSGKVELLLMLGVNPVYDAPADLDFVSALDRVKTRVHFGLYEDETAEHSQWHINETHPLETWSDVRGFDGTISLMQPLIEPLFYGRSAHQILSAVLGQSGKTGLELLKENWKSRWEALRITSPSLEVDFEKFWRRMLHDGVIPGTAFKPKKVKARISELKISYQPSSETEIIFRPDPSVWDGRFANNAWLQELPKPITKITWDNTVWIAPRMAEKLLIQNRDEVELSLGGRFVKGAAWIVPGHPENSVTVFLGYGRTRSGKVGTGAGFNVNPLRASSALWAASGVKVVKTGRKLKVSVTQDHHAIEGRDHIRTATLEENNKDHHWVHKKGPHIPPHSDLYPPMPQSQDYAWGMVIDMNACTGCNACVVACQSENNIPVVGKDEVARGREMQWMRIDHYYSGSPDAPESINQPLLCMHCEQAPCEPVCPVGATTHSAEGLNEMTYNRCVGTRYCANNCPYKVRRFNFFEYADHQTEILKFLRNPDVTVRSRGVMEKCTYCVQRINAARIQSKREDRKIKDGEVVTACEAACASGCITFGNIKDPESKVSKKRKSHLNYGLLEELNTKPRTTYLAKVKNINPEIEVLQNGR